MAWYSRFAPSRLTSAVRTLTRAVGTAIAGLRAPPPRPGITAGRVASLPHAEAHLGAMATSPTVYGALTRRSLELATHPIVVYRGWSMAGGGLTPITDTPPWVEAFYELLAIWDQREALALAPVPGERHIAQIVADLIATGNFVVVPTVGSSGNVTSLARLHPGCCVIERHDGAEDLVYRNGGEYRRYPVSSVFIGGQISWQRDGRGLLGTGAGAALEYITRAEAAAWRQTADTIEQGGPDLKLVAKGATGMQFLANKEKRKEILEGAVEALKAVGRRVLALGADIDLEPLGLPPAELRAPELLEASRGAELVATGTVPAWVGMEAGTYATAVIQLRVQAGNDEAIATILESAFLRPLAQNFARYAGGMDARRFRQVTARVDLSQHPGYIQLRKEQIDRATALVRLGYTTEQAVAAEHLDLPKPLGQVMLGGQPQDPTPGPDPGSTQDTPRAPVGGGGDPAVRLADLFGRKDAELVAK